MTHSTLYFDGGGTNPGIMQLGIVIHTPSYTPFYKHWNTEQWGTINEAEILALCMGLECAKEMGIEKLRVMGDSQLAIKLVKKEWKTSKPHLQALQDYLLTWLEENPFSAVDFNWISREYNIAGWYIAVKESEQKKWDEWLKQQKILVLG